MKKIFKIIIVTITLIFFLVGCDKTTSDTLKIGVNDLPSTYNPFYYTMDIEKEILDLTQLKLFPVVNGETLYNSSSDEGEEYNGKVYYGVASLNESEKENTDYYDYTITLREGILSLDGDEIDYKDLIFNLYFLLDSSYKGTVDLKSLPILGVSEYQNKKSDNIEGINLLGQKIVITMTRKLESEELSKLNIYLAPLAYYGNKNLFNYNMNSFGFERGKTSKINQNKGAGKYYISSFSDSTLKLTKNNVYYLSENNIEKIHFVKITTAVYDEDDYRISGGNVFELMYDGKFDIALVDINDYTTDEVTRYNVNGKLEGNIFYLNEFEDESGKGYLISTKRVDTSSIKKLNLSLNNLIYDHLSEIILK